MGVPAEGGVLLPGYLGWSSREGSGVFDPVRELGAPYGFYRMTRELHIDLHDLEQQVIHFRPRVVLLIHYFGYPDPNCCRAAEIARNAGSLVIEDEAHALFSDLIGKACGRTGNAAFFSLHKMLPFDSGGLVLFNDSNWSIMSCAGMHRSESNMMISLAEYDLAQISYLRIRNVIFLLDKLAALSPHLKVLRPQLPSGVVPQTLPVLLHKAPRNEIYSAMNQAGFGVVSLYHTLIDEISSECFPDAHWISDRIINLPVHQDATLEALDRMLFHLAGLLERWS